jgi:hypothetical protein
MTGRYLRGISEKLLACLREAGSDGCSSAELAEKLFGKSSYTERVAGMIRNLRRKGYVIATVIVFGGERRPGRYVLYEKGAPSESPKHDDEPSPRSHPDVKARGAR